MKCWFRIAPFIVVFTSLCAWVPAHAQQVAKVAPEPKTKLEAFERQTGRVVIKGYSEMGGIAGLGSVSVLCMEFTDATSSDKQRGIVVEVKESGRLERSERSFIDYDEIDPLLKGIDYISKVKSSVTRLNAFEAKYKTKGDFVFTTYSSRQNGSIEAAVTSGYISTTTAYISLEKLQELRAIIVKAKATLDAK